MGSTATTSSRTITARSCSSSISTSASRETCAGRWGRRRSAARAMPMDIALQLLFTGLGVGSIYALVALGFVLIYRATNVVNFAQGDFAMVGAFAMVVLTIDFGLPYWVGIVLTILVLPLFGAAFNRAVYFPLRNRGYLPVIISTLGASIFLENGMLAAYGPRPQSLLPVFASQGINLGPVFLDSQYLVILATTVIMV